MASVRTMITLPHDEILLTIPYAEICTTRETTAWDSRERKRRWHAEFTEAEREKCGKLFALAHSWYLVKGVPETVDMSLETFALCNKLASF